MRFEPVPALPDLVLVRPRVHEDRRGFFLESFHRDRFREAGLPARFVQSNHSRSGAGVLRGLHYQWPPGQGKLVGVVRGAVFDVAVDVREGSPTFARWFGARLDAERRHQLWIPPGFAHGFAVLEAPADVTYACTDIYRPDVEHALRWDDPEVGVDWPTEDPLLSPKDAAAPSLGELRARGELPSGASTPGAAGGAPSGSARGDR